LKNYLSIKRFILINWLILSVAFLFSCNPVKLQEINLEKISQSSSGGDVYGGKQYVLPTPVTNLCEDGRAIKSILIQNVAGVYTLVRDNCEFLSTPKDVAREEVTSENSGGVTYKNQKYIERYADAGLPVSYIPGITTKWCRGKLSSTNATGSTALLEFAEQADGQFSGQIAWLDYKEGGFDYYNAFEIRLFYNNEYPEPLLGISGTDVVSGITARVRIGLGSDYTVSLTKGSSSALLSLSCTGF